MSALRNPANDLDDVTPFIRLGVAFTAYLANVDDAREAYLAPLADVVAEDVPAREAVEGGPAEPAEVPGAAH